MELLRSTIIASQHEGIQQLLTTIKQYTPDIQSGGADSLQLLTEGSNVSNAYVLSCITKSLHHEKLLDAALNVILACTTQQQLIPISRSVVLLCRMIETSCIATNRLADGITIFHHILSTKLITESSATLTPVHTVYLSLCLRAADYEAAKRIADIPIYDVGNNAQASTGITAADVLLYFFYAGSLYVILRHWRAASDAFRCVLLVPSQILSAVAVEAYKKWVLVSLLAAPMSAGIGSGPALLVPALPKSISKFVEGVIEKEAAHPYLKVAKAFVTLERERLMRAVTDEEQRFAADSNIELVQTVLESAARRRIVRLSQTYTSVALSEVAAAIGGGETIEQAAQVAGTMIAEGLLEGMIDTAAGMLVFQEEGTVGGGSKEQGLLTTMAATTSSSSSSVSVGSTTEGSGSGSGSDTNEQQLTNRLFKEIDQLMAAVARVKQIDDKLSIDPALIRQIVQLRTGGGGDSSDMGSGRRKPAGGMGGARAGGGSSSIGGGGGVGGRVTETHTVESDAAFAASLTEE